MSAGEKDLAGPRPGRAWVVVVVLVALLSLAVAATPSAAKKKGKSPVSTASAAVPISSGNSASATANCKGKTHATGGGYAVAPSYNPDPNTLTGTGLRSMTVTTNPVGNKSWAAAGGAFTNPAGASGTFTTFAQCESNKLGKIAIRASSSATLAPGGGQSLVFNCPQKTHAIAGGFSGDPPSALNSINGWKVVVLQSFRSAKGQWTITAYNRSPPPANTSATITGWAVCEFDQKGVSVGQRSASVPVPENGRAATSATCKGKSHVVSGGFTVNPASFPGEVPVIGIDENQPVGKKSWHIGLHEWQGNGEPAGTSLTTYAYCKKDSPAKKK
jgi:hypothetical protein